MKDKELQERTKRGNLDAIGMDDIKRKLDLKDHDIQLFLKNITNRFFLFNDIDILIESNEEHDTLNIFKSYVFNNESSPYYFTFETLTLLKILIESTRIKYLTGKGEIKKMTYQEYFKFHENLIELVNNNKNKYGIKRLAYSKGYTNTLVSLKSVQPFIEQIDPILQLVSKDSNKLDKSKLLLDIIKNTNSFLFNTIIDTDKSAPFYNSIEQGLLNKQISLDEQIIQNMIIENTIGYNTPIIPPIEKVNFPENVSVSKKYLFNLMKATISNENNADEQRKYFFENLKEKNSLKKLLIEYFEKIYLENLALESFYSDTAYSKFTKSMSEISFEDFYKYSKTNKNFVDNHELNRTETDIEELLILIDEYLIKKSIDFESYEIFSSKIIKLNTEQQENIDIYTDFFNYYFKNDINNSTVDSFREEYKNIIQFEVNKRDKEIKKLNNILDSLDETTNNDLIDQFSKSVEELDTNVREDIETLKNEIFQFTNKYV